MHSTSHHFLLFYPFVVRRQRVLVHRLIYIYIYRLFFFFFSLVLRTTNTLSLGSCLVAVDVKKCVECKKETEEEKKQRMKSNGTDAKRRELDTGMRLAVLVERRHADELGSFSFARLSIDSTKQRNMNYRCWGREVQMIVHWIDESIIRCYCNCSIERRKTRTTWPHR
jgi:hypothetical protein